MKTSTLLINNISGLALILLSFLVLSCGRSASEHNVDVDRAIRLSSFMNGRASKGIEQKSLAADSLFNAEYVLPDSGAMYVYVLDGSCSSCIASALDLYSLYRGSGTESDNEILFFSKSEENDLFRYYFCEHMQANGLEGSIPRIFAMYERETVENGLYRVENGTVKAFMPWNY